MVLYLIGIILLKLLLTVAVVLGIYKIIVFISRRYERGIRRDKSNAIEIVRKRFAAGEIEERNLGLAHTASRKFRSCASVNTGPS